MVRRIGALLETNAARSFTGRSQELGQLLSMLEHDQPPIWFVHDISGIGKSRLLAAFSTEARQLGANVVSLDCRAIEPTAEAFLRAIAEALEVPAGDAQEMADRLGATGDRFVLILDSFETFRLLDSWLRTAFIPLIPEHGRIVLGSKLPPGVGWTREMGWAGLVRQMPLGPLAEEESLAFLIQAGFDQTSARRLNRMTRGHPLALQLAIASFVDAVDPRLAGETIPRVIDQLARIYLADVSDATAREVLEAASVVRRVTRSVLSAMLPDLPGDGALDRLSKLPFVERRADGLMLHESVQTTIAASLQASDPERYRTYRRAAWLRLRHESRNASPTELWRYTADLLFLLDTAALREGFFPSGQLCQVDQATPADQDEILAISERHEPPEATALLAAWWDQAPETFLTVRDDQNQIAGYGMLVVADTAPAGAMQADPVTRSWLRHLRNDPVPPRQRVIFSRSWADREAGEGASAVQAALWINVKRLYMEMRPHLRRVYVCQRDFSVHLQAFKQLGFVELNEAAVTIGGVPYHSIMLDFGPGSVDGWLSGLVGTQLSIAEQGLLDVPARELVIDGTRTGLTKLEFALLHYLAQREGQAVSRSDLLLDVWGTDYDGGSNVVDVVVRSLRQKMGLQAGRLETVRGTGYRLRSG